MNDSSKIFKHSLKIYSYIYHKHLSKQNISVIKRDQLMGETLAYCTYGRENIL